MKKKELTKTFMMISNWKNPLVSMVYAKIISACCCSELYEFGINVLSSGGGRREVSDDIPDPRTDYFKFIQVRHPLERLASAYVDKVQGYNAKTKGRLIHMKVRYYLDLLLRGLVKLKQIQKSEKNSDWSDTTLPPPSIFLKH